MWLINLVDRLTFPSCNRMQLDLQVRLCVATSVVLLHFFLHLLGLPFAFADR